MGLIFSGIKTTINNSWGTDYLVESEFKIITIINICVIVYNSQNVFKYNISFEAHRSQPRWGMKMEMEPQKGHSTIKWQKQNMNQILLISNTMALYTLAKEMDAFVNFNIIYKIHQCIQAFCQRVRVCVWVCVCVFISQTRKLDERICNYPLQKQPHMKQRAVFNNLREI